MALIDHVRATACQAFAVAVVAMALLYAGCGGEDVDREPTVEAREGNTVDVGGISYRVAIFRQLNVRIPPDDGYWDGPPPERGEGYYGAFLVACNHSGAPRTPTEQIHLEDAFGEAFQPQPIEHLDEYAYRPRPLTAGECVPRQESVGDRAAPGGLLVFEVPFEEAQERPFVLSIADARASDEESRIEVDL